MSRGYERVPLDESNDGGAGAAATALPEVTAVAPAPPAPRVVATAAPPAAAAAPSFLSTLLRNPRAALASLFADDAAGAASTPASRAREFVDGLQRSYGPHVPAFRECALSEALAACDAECRPLLVYLQSDLHEDAQSFASGALCMQPFCDFVNSRFILWGASVHGVDGYDASLRFDADAYPFLAVYTLGRGSTARAPKYARVWAHDGGFLPAADLVARIQGGCEQVLTQMETLQAERLAREHDRELRAEQERQYEEAEAEDRRRVGARRAAEAEAARAAAEAARAAAAAAQAEAEARAAAEEAAELASAIALSKALHKESVLQAALRRMQGHPEPPPPAAGAPPGDVTTIQFTLPSNHKLQRRFLATEPVQCLFDFCVVASDHLGCPILHFDMGCNYPKVVLAETAVDMTQSIRGAGFPGRVAIFVTQTPAQKELDRQDILHDDAGAAAVAAAAVASPPVGASTA